MSSTTASGLLAILIGAGVAVVTFIPLVAIAYRRRGRLGPARLLGWIALCVYAIALWTYTLIPIPAIGDYQCVTPQLNPLDSFDDILDYDTSSPRAILTNPAVLQFVFNIALFVPLGFLLRTMYRRGVGFAALAGLVVSLLIELTQLTGVWGLFPCAYRLFDLTDLAMNTLGAILGSLLAIAFTRRRPDALPDSAAPDAARPVTAGRRLLGMLCDVLFLLLAGAVLGVLWRAGIVALGGSLDAGEPVENVLVTWVPLAAQLVVVLVSGSTIGEHAVLVRPGALRMPVLATRLLRFVTGIGGYGLLTAFTFPGSGLLVFVFVVASVIMVFTTRGHRGLAYVASGAELAAARGS